MGGITPHPLIAKLASRNAIPEVLPLINYWALPSDTAWILKAKQELWRVKPYINSPTISINLGTCSLLYIGQKYNHKDGFNIDFVPLRINPSFQVSRRLESIFILQQI